MENREGKKHQLISVHGGETFDSREEFLESLKTRREYNPYGPHRKSWKKWLFTTLEDYDVECFAPDMPNLWFADYEAWKIWFEKTYAYLNEKSDGGKIILIGHSLGGIFLTKYLSENEFPKKIDQLHLLAAAFDDEGLVGEKLGNFKFDPENLKNILPQCEKICLYQSRDDDITPYSHSQKYLKYMKDITFCEFEDKGHFINRNSFIELFENIVKDL